MQAPNNGVEINTWGGLECKHRFRAVRLRTRKNGVQVFCEQCLICGNELRTVAKGAPAVMGLTEVSQFDECLQDEWFRRGQEYRQRRVEQDEIDRAKADAAWWKQYNDYINSKAWKRKAALVKERAGGMCEACLVNIAVHVHHTSYRNVGNEIMWELRAVCVSCHQRLHPDKDLRRG